MWVVKLGGSLADSDHLPRWLDVLAPCPVIIVPGGGPFADAVRTAQARWGFNDRSAHDMALLAMQQYGRMLLGLCPMLQALDFAPQAVGEESRWSSARVWLPEPAVLNAAGVSASWDITSDSLAAWLAVVSGAGNLLLVKSVRSGSFPRSMDCRTSIEQGLIDPAFRDYGRDGALQSWWCGPDDHAHWPLAWRRPERYFVRITDDLT